MSEQRTSSGGRIGGEGRDAAACLKLANDSHRSGNGPAAIGWLKRVTQFGDDFVSWQSAASLLARVRETHTPPAKRTVKVALLGSYTTAQMASLLPLAALAFDMDLEVYEGPYGAYRQEIINSIGPLYEADPDFVVIAVHEGEVAFPQIGGKPEDLDAELSRWTSLWDILKQRVSARIIQHNIAIRPDSPIGHVAASLEGSRYRMLQDLNSRLGLEAGERVAILDCERLASLIGKRRWFDDRYWYFSKQGVSLEALPLLVRHTAALIAAELGLTRKCVVVDLDNTLWGGVIGEDDLSGIRLGDGPHGEAFVAFQEYLLELKRRGILLAVCSKNNEMDARLPFERHPDMRIKLDDVAVFLANWAPKPENLTTIAERLNIGLDALVFVDDDPVEREIVRLSLPEVAVIRLPDDPAYYVRAVSESLLFEARLFTQEDAQRTEQYRARAQIAELESSASTLEEFYTSLEMRAEIAPIDGFHLPRVVQLIGKTNQFNLTTRRHSRATVEAFLADQEYVHLYLKLRDRFADHGLVGVLIARRIGDLLDIDTWLLSCRAIGRTAEAAMLGGLVVEAQMRGCTRLRGTYIPTTKNAVVSDLFSRFGFRLVEEQARKTVWECDVAALDPSGSQFIERVVGRDDAEVA